MKKGIKAGIKVKGFHDAKSWIYRLIGDGVAKCASCDNPATNVFWNDRAEWYCYCEEHREYGQMWTGSTDWNPAFFTKVLVYDKAQGWYNGLEKEDKKLVKLKEFDATDYYSLIDEEVPTFYHYLIGKAEDEYYWRAEVHSLTDGRYAYTLEVRTGNMHRGYALAAPYTSVQECIEMAKARIPKQTA